MLIKPSCLDHAPKSASPTSRFRTIRCDNRTRFLECLSARCLHCWHFHLLSTVHRRMEAPWQRVLEGHQSRRKPDEPVQEDSVDPRGACVSWYRAFWDRSEWHSQGKSAVLSFIEKQRKKQSHYVDSTHLLVILRAAVIVDERY